MSASRDEGHFPHIRAFEPPHDCPKKHIATNSPEENKKRQISGKLTHIGNIVD
jgi:hypothetical protein